MASAPLPPAALDAAASPPASPAAGLPAESGGVRGSGPTPAVLLRLLASPLRFHAQEASAETTVASDAFPPAICVSGLAPRLRGWVPTDEALALADAAGGASDGVPAEAVLLRPALDYGRDGDGDEHTPRSRHPLLAASEGGWFAAADAHPRGCLTVFRHDPAEPAAGFQKVWRLELLHDAGTLAELRQTGGEASLDTRTTTITALAFSGREVAVGSGSGYVHVWRRADKDTLEESDGETNAKAEQAYERLMQPLWVDATPVRNVAVSSTVVVAHSPSKTTFVTWSLADGKLLGCWNHNAVTKLPLRYARLVGANALVAAHWGGGQCAVQLLDVVGGKGGGVPLVEGGKGMACEPSAFDGSIDLLVFGDAEGTIRGFFDPTPKLSAEGASSDAETGSAAAAATGNETSWVRWTVSCRGAVGAVRVVDESTAVSRVFAGCADGSVKAMRGDGTVIHTVVLNHAVTSVFAPREHGRFAVAGTQTGDVELLVVAPVPEGEDVPQDEGGVAIADVAQYDRCFVAGPADDPSNLGRASTKPAGYDEISRALLSELSRDVDAAAVEAALGTAALAGSGGKASKFNFAKGLDGAKRDGEEDVESETSRKNIAAMDAPGVARNPNAAALQDLGRKCSNPSCLVREAVSPLPFKRCARCRKTFYCSQHCQRTHWRDGHAKACGKEEKKDAAEYCPPVAAPVAAAPSAVAPPEPAPAPEPAEAAPSAKEPAPVVPPHEQGLYDLD